MLKANDYGTKAYPHMYNIVRKHNGDVEIFKRYLFEKAAKTEVKHWKNMARNSGGHVYFDMVLVPWELTPAGIEEAVANQRPKELLDAERDQLLTDPVAA